MNILIAFCWILSANLLNFINAIQLPPIYWNSSNEMFHHEGVLTVKLKDAVDIHCPFYNDTVTQDEAEYSIIYKVSQKEYDGCQLEESALPVGQCVNPVGGTPTILKFTFREFSPLPGAIEVAAGETVYFITTSNGTTLGITNRKDGLCRTAHMRLKIKVMDESTQLENALEPDNHKMPTQDDTDWRGKIRKTGDGLYATGRASSIRKQSTTESRHSSINDREENENDKEAVGVKFIVDDNKLIQSTLNGGGISVDLNGRPQSDGRTHSFTYDFDSGSSVKRDYPLSKSGSPQGSTENIVLFEIHEIDAQRISRFNYNSAASLRPSSSLYWVITWCVLIMVMRL